MIKIQTLASTTLALLALTACNHALTSRSRIPTPSTAVDSNLNRQIVNAANTGDGDYPLRLLRARLEANPNDLAARLEIAERYQTLGYPEIALEHARLLIDRAPDFEDARIALARFQRDADHSPEAERALTAFAGTHTASARLWAWIGLLRDDQGDWKNGEIAHRKAVALAPGHDDLHNNLGYCLLQQGRKQEAAAEFAAALKINPRSVIARNNLGTSLTESSKEAVLHLQSVTDPATAHNNLAAALIEAGRYDEARQELSLALGYNRQHSAALRNLDLIAQLDGKPAELKSPARQEGKWARRVVSVWRNFWGVPPRQDQQTGNKNGRQVASR